MGGVRGGAGAGAGGGAGAEHGARASHRDQICSLSSSFQPWLHAAGAGGTGPCGLGPDRLPPGVPRVGAGHAWDWMGARGGLRALSGGLGATLWQSWRGERGETGGGPLRQTRCGWCTGQMARPVGRDTPRVRQRSTTMRRGDNICPQMRKGVNEGALEVSGAREVWGETGVCL